MAADSAGIPALATKKVGPLPLIAWVALAAGGVVIWRRFHGGTSKATPAAAPVTPAVDQSLPSLGGTVQPQWQQATIVANNADANHGLDGGNGTPSNSSTDIPDANDDSQHRITDTNRIPAPQSAPRYSDHQSNDPYTLAYWDNSMPSRTLGLGMPMPYAPTGPAAQ